ncbi:MAG: type II toxin-antitoxin system prevent-host-death family antitoxin [Acidobacteriaceae bacterium]|jgi:prevent-host-death family protein
MEKAISATDANRQFSRLLDGVRRGRTYLVTSHGQPIARISPVDASGTTVAEARRSLLASLRSQKPAKASHWTRDELYEEDKR